MNISLKPKLIKITFTTEINVNTRCIIKEETETLGVKPLRPPPSGKQSTKECSWDT